MTAAQSEVAVYDGRVRLGAFSQRGRAYACVDSAGKKLKAAASRAAAVSVVCDAAKGQINNSLGNSE
jgi:hypothetical protein